MTHAHLVALKTSVECLLHESLGYLGFSTARLIRPAGLESSLELSTLLWFLRFTVVKQTG